MSSWQPTKQTESTKSKTRKSKTPKQHSAATAEHRTPPHTLKASELHGCTHKKVSSLPVKKSSLGPRLGGGSRRAGRKRNGQSSGSSGFRLKLPLLCCAVLATGIRGSVETEEELYWFSRNKNSSFSTSFHSSTWYRRMSFLGAAVQRPRGAEAVGSSRPTGPAAAPI